MSWFLRAVASHALMVSVINGAKPVAAYRVLALDGGVADVGLVAASFGFLALFAAVIAGPLVDRMAEERFLVGGMAGLAVSAAILATTDSIIGLAIGMCILGVTQMVAAVSIQALVANAGPPAERDRRFATQTMFAALGHLLGPAVAGFIITLGSSPSSPSLDSTTTFFLVASAAGGIATILCASLWISPAPRVERIPAFLGGARGRGSSMRRVLQTPSLPQAIVASMAILAAIDLLAAYLPVLGEANGLDAATVGILLSTRALASLGSRAAFGVLLARLGRRKLMIASLVVPALGIGAIPIAAGSHPALLFAIVFVMGAGLGLGAPLTLVWVAGKAPPELRATALGLRLSGNRLAQVVVPGIASLVAGTLGLGATFVVLALLLLAAGALTATAPFDEHPVDEAVVVPP